MYEGGWGELFYQFNVVNVHQSDSCPSIINLEMKSIKVNQAIKARAPIIDAIVNPEATSIPVLTAAPLGLLLEPDDDALPELEPPVEAGPEVPEVLDPPVLPLPVAAPVAAGAALPDEPLPDELPEELPEELEPAKEARFWTVLHVAAWLACLLEAS
jgi:hypothetical protein